MSVQNWVSVKEHADWSGYKNLRWPPQSLHLKKGFQSYQSAHFHHHQTSHNNANPTRTEKQATAPAEERL